MVCACWTVVRCCALDQEDVSAEAADKVPTYFAGAFETNGMKFKPQLTGTGSNIQAVFESPRFQKSVVSLTISADSLRYVVNVYVRVPPCMSKEYGFVLGHFLNMPCRGYVYTASFGYIAPLFMYIDCGGVSSAVLPALFRTSRSGPSKP